LAGAAKTRIKRSLGCREETRAHSAISGGRVCGLVRKRMRTVMGRIKRRGVEERRTVRRAEIEIFRRCPCEHAKEVGSTHTTAVGEKDVIAWAGGL